jgi:hypothetical protein
VLKYACDLRNNRVAVARMPLVGSSIEEIARRYDEPLL